MSEEIIDCTKLKVGDMVRVKNFWIMDVPCRVWDVRENTISLSDGCHYSRKNGYHQYMNRLIKTRRIVEIL